MKDLNIRTLIKTTERKFGVNLSSSLDYEKRFI